ncbi:MAG: hypothetical protein WC975_15560 [Phycisphaerae bacterium]
MVNPIRFVQGKYNGWLCSHKNTKILPRRALAIVPHFELRFFLTMETFCKVHPEQRSYAQWDQMEEKERILHRKDIAQLLIDVA